MVLTRLVAIRIPSGAQVRVLQVSFLVFVEVFPVSLSRREEEEEEEEAAEEDAVWDGWIRFGIVWSDIASYLLYIVSQGLWTSLFSPRLLVFKGVNFFADRTCMPAHSSPERSAQPFRRYGLVAES